MLQIKQTFNSVLDKQYPCPNGLVGRFVGELMVRQHKEETAWTVSLADVQPCDHVLEIGFGAGKALELLANKAMHGRVYGIDRSTTMVRHAGRRNARAVRTGRVILQPGEAEQLPFEGQQFDWVISIHTFYGWSEDPQVVLKEMFRVLKPGGKLIFAFANGKVGEERDYYQTEIEEKVLPQMKQIGFTDILIKSGPVARQFKNVAIMGTKSSF